MIPLVTLVTKNTEELLVTRIPAVEDLKESDIGTEHVIPELELTVFTSLSKQWADQVRICKEACAVGNFGVDVIT